MIAEDGYRAQMRFVPMGGIDKKVFWVKYDKEYVMAWLLRKVLVPLGHLDKEVVIKLIEEAYDYESAE